MLTFLALIAVVGIIVTLVRKLNETETVEAETTTVEPTTTTTESTTPSTSSSTTPTDTK